MSVELNIHADPSLLLMQPILTNKPPGKADSILTKYGLTLTPWIFLSVRLRGSLYVLARGARSTTE